MLQVFQKSIILFNDKSLLTCMQFHVFLSNIHNDKQFYGWLGFIAYQPL